MGPQRSIPLLAGEGDMPTPSFITDATTRSLAAGENIRHTPSGIPEYRVSGSALYVEYLWPSVKSDRFVCTIGCMHAMQIAMRMILTQGDEI